MPKGYRPVVNRARLVSLLENGETFAFSQSDDKHPSSKGLVNGTCKIGAILCIVPRKVRI